MIHILGWSGNILFLTGVYLLGKKNINGFYSNSIANLLYAWQSIILANHALFWLSIGLIILNLKGIWEWRNCKSEPTIIESPLQTDYSRRVIEKYTENL